MFNITKQVCFATVIVTLSLASCTKDYYDPEYMQEQARNVFPVRNIDSNQTWETSSLVSATVTTGSSERLYIYQGNPYSSSDNAKLLAVKEVQAGTTTVTFDAPTALQTIFVARQTEMGLSEARAATVENGQLTVDFTESAASRAARKSAPRREKAYSDSWVEDDVTASNTAYFPTDAPAGAEQYRGEWSTAADKVFVIDGSNANQINVGAVGDFYIKGEVTLNSLNIGSVWGDTKQARIFLLPNSTLHLPNGLYAAYPSTISVGAGATLDCGSSKIQLANDLGAIYNAGTITSGEFYSSTPRQLYNLGTINISGQCNLTNMYVMNKGTFTSATKLYLNSSTMFINEGTLDVNWRLHINNAETKLINRGTMTAGSYSLEGSGCTVNEAGGEVTVDTLSTLTSNNSTWENEGKWTTKDFSLTSISQNWLNACQLYVTNEFYCTLGDGNGGFNIDGGGYVECATASISNIRINLGSGAQFNCKGTATFGWTNPNNHGFYGVGDEAGVARFKQTVERTPGQANAMQYGGNLIVACDNHFALVIDGDAGGNYKVHGSNVTFSAYNGGITAIAASNCAPGVTPTPTPLPTEPQVYTYAFEDMTIHTGDYDFNDVVFTVSAPIDNKVTLTLMAAGATKTLSLCWKKTRGNSDNIETIFADIHTALNVPAGQMTNTFIDGHNSATPVATVIEVPEDFNLTDNGDFFIADSYGTVHLPRFTEGFQAGDVPYAICVPGKWLWPVEFMVINEAYQKFSLWAQDATQEMLWYDTPVEDRVIDIY